MCPLAFQSYGRPSGRGERLSAHHGARPHRDIQKHLFQIVADGDLARLAALLLATGFEKKMGGFHSPERGRGRVRERCSWMVRIIANNVLYDTLSWAACKNSLSLSELFGVKLCTLFGVPARRQARTGRAPNWALRKPVAIP